MNRKRLLLIMATFAVVASLLASGTFGVSNSQVDRGITGVIADDDSAYIGLDQTVSAENETANMTLTVSNNHPSNTLTNIAVYSDGDKLNTSSERLTQNSQTTLRVTNITCGADIRIEVTGEKTASTLYRTVDCP